jgi:hypothetical protein
MNRPLPFPLLLFGWKSLRSFPGEHGTWVWKYDSGRYTLWGIPSVRACPIPLFNSRQLRRQSWVIPGIFSRCGVYMNSPLLLRPAASSTWDFLALVLASQLPTRSGKYCHNHRPPCTNPSPVHRHGYGNRGIGHHRQCSLGGGFGKQLVAWLLTEEGLVDGVIGDRRVAAAIAFGPYTATATWWVGVPG